MTGRPVSAPGTVSTKEVLAGARYGASKWRMAIRQSIFGVFMGAIPGIGSAVIDWLSYAFGMALTKDKSEFGKGSLDGVLFAEAAQNSKEGGQAIPRWRSVSPAARHGQSCLSDSSSTVSLPGWGCSINTWM